MEIFDDTNAIIASGLFFYRHLHGRPALRAFAADFRANAVEPSAVNGHFAMLVEQDGAAHLLTDQLGACKIYHNDDCSWLSDSYVLMLGMAGAKTLISQSVYEYAWYGTVFGGRTFFQQIASFDPAAVYRLTGSVEALARSINFGMPDFSRAPRQEILEHFRVRLARLFALYGEHFRDRIECSMSGGLDSRLMLAALLRRGVAPAVLVYGTKQTLDVSIAREVAAGKGLEFKHVQKNPGDDVTLADFPALMCQIHWAFDGWGVTGAFMSDAELLERLRRGRSGLYMNGSLGEIFRNSFHKPDRELTACQIAGAFFSQYASTWTTAVFQPREYARALSAMIRRSVGGARGSMSRRAVELVYPLVRGRYWTARDLAINLRFGPAACPFMEASVIAGTCTIPLSVKAAARFEHALIRLIDADLINYRTCYSNDPRRPYSFRRSIDYVSSVHRPLFMRKYSYRVKQALRPALSLPKTLTLPYLSSVIDPDFPYMSRYFHIGRIKDHAVLSRVATMEYLCQRYGATNEF